MKKIHILLILITFLGHTLMLECNRYIPDWQWNTEPLPLLEHTRVRYQAKHDSPLASDGNNGAYLVQNFVEDGSALYSLYISPQGDVAHQLTDYQCFYNQIDIEPLTGNCIGVYENNNYEGPVIELFYNMEHETNDPLSWVDLPVTVFDENSPVFTFNDVFNEPEFLIGDSPLGDDYRRIYVIARNMEMSDGPCNGISKNVNIAWQDYTITDLEAGNMDNWQYTSIPQMDNWNSENPQWGDPTCSFVCEGNLLICSGWVMYEEDPDQLFCFVNDDYGMGEWQEYYETLQINIQELDPQVFPYIFRACHRQLCGDGFNLIKYYDNNFLKIAFAGNMAIFTQPYGNLLGYDETRQMCYPKMFEFDLEEQQFSIIDVFPQGLAAADDNMMMPWDLDEDGEIDEFDEEGNPIWERHWPCSYTEPWMVHTTGANRLAVNSDNGWIANVWVDCSNAQRYYLGDEDFAQWEGLSEIAVAVSFDRGNHWSEPIRFNGNPQSENYVPELQGRMLCYPDVDDNITDLGDDYGLLHLTFMGDCDDELDNYSMGITYYCSLEIDFSNTQQSNSQLAAQQIAVTSYPNPFNPQTIISFTLQSNEGYLAIYNALGQIMQKRAFPKGVHQYNWNAQDLPSGVYICKIKDESYCEYHKMLLLK